MRNSSLKFESISTRSNCDQNGGDMVAYRCYILDVEDHILQAHDLDCENDAEAEAAAKLLLTRDPYHRGAEVWKATRRVAKLDRDPAIAARLVSDVQRSARRLGSVV